MKSVFNDGSTLECPNQHCDSEFLHPIKVVVNRGGRITEITSTASTDTQGDPVERGVEIKIFYLCEDGHISVMNQQFHKDATLWIHQALSGDDAAAEKLSGDVLWRD